MGKAPRQTRAVTRSRHRRPLPRGEELLMLPARDVAYLRDCGQRYDVLADGGFVCLVLREYELPPGYTPATTDVLIRVPPGFPDAAPDMWWCSPPVRLAATGEYPIAADA